jgi:putative FmdB family regulatory protein
LDHEEANNTVPIYEYTCKACHETFEQLQRTMSSAGDATAAKVKCPACGSTRTARTLSVFAVGAEASGGKAKASSDAPPGMCGRCGGPGPCGSGGF